MYVAQEAQIHDSLMVDAVYVGGRVSHSLISTGVTVEEHAIVDHSVVMPGAVIVGTPDDIAVVGCGEYYNQTTVNEGVLTNA